MARIPDVTALGERRVPRGGGPIFEDHSGAIQAESIGNAARQLQTAVSSFVDSRAEFRKAAALSEFSKLESTARLFDDNDYETYEKRYRDTLTKAKESALKNVRTPRDRDELNLQLDNAIERGALSVREAARGKEIEFGRATLSATLDNFRTAALSVTDEATRTRNIEGAQLAIKSALDSQYIDPTDAEKLNKTWTQSYAEGLLTIQTPEKQIEMLSDPKGSIAQYVPPDKRALLLDRAKRETHEILARGTSQQIADRIMEKGPTLRDAMAEARKVKDPEVRDMVEQRVQRRYNTEVAAQRALSDEIFDRTMDAIEQGATRDNISTQDWLNLAPPHRAAIEARLAAPNGIVATDAKTFLDLAEMSSREPEKFVSLDLRDYAAKLSLTDLKKFAGVQEQLRTNPNGEHSANYRTINQTVEEYTNMLFGGKQTRSTMENRLEFRKKFEDRKIAWEASNKRKLTSREARDVLDEMVMSVVVDRSWWSTEKKPAYLVTLEDVPEADRNEIIHELQKRGKPVTEQSVIDLYNRVNGKRVRTSAAAETLGGAVQILDRQLPTPRGPGLQVADKFFQGIQAVEEMKLDAAPLEEE